MDSAVDFTESTKDIIEDLGFNFRSSAMSFSRDTFDEGFFEVYNKIREITRVAYVRISKINEILLKHKYDYTKYITKDEEDEGTGNECIAESASTLFDSEAVAGDEVEVRDAGEAVGVVDDADDVLGANSFPTPKNLEANFFCCSRCCFLITLLFVLGYK